MRILYLAYNFQESFMDFSERGRTGCPWVDSALGNMHERPGIFLALGVPVNGFRLLTGEVNGIKLYGLPVGDRDNPFRKAYRNLTHSHADDRIVEFIPGIIEDFKPDIIQVFGSENPFGLIVSGKTVPVIIHIQGFLAICVGKWFSGISKWEQFKYAGLKSLLLMHGSYNEYLVVRKRAYRETRILKNCRYFIGRTEFDKRVTRLLSPDSEYFHCEEFIRNDFFSYKLRSGADSSVRCISVLKGTTYKGVELLVNAFIILQEHSALRFELKVCGVSSDNEVVKFVKRKFRTDIDNLNIQFLGKLETQNLIEQLRDSDLYINPSHIENSPNSVCEAMLLGLPVISTSVGGVNSIITNGSDGILVQEGEPYAMAAAILELAKDPGLASSLGQKARERALRRHDPEEIGKTLMGIYSRIVTEHGS